MKTKTFLFFLLSGISFAALGQDDTVTISGRVTDFDGNPIDSAVVLLTHANFDTAFETYSDPDGYYTLSGVKKGRYATMYALRNEEYPRENAVPKADMRLEFWGWNIIADRDMTIDARYHKLELYGTTVFEQHGGYPAMFIYTRPMSVTRYISYDELFLDKAQMEGNDTDISVLPEYFDVEVFADGEPLEVYSVQPVEEYVGETAHQFGYLIQTSRPKQRTDKPYIVFRVVATNREYDEKGENIYFYELKNYE